MEGLSLRPVRADDAEVLYRIYAGTRADELAGVPWDDRVKEAFLRQQFDAQSAAYEQYEGRSHQLVLLDGAPVGRLYVARRDDEMRIVDIALLPEHRGAGIGTAVLRDVLDEAAAGGLVVRIHVERENRALGLYRRLGFVTVGEYGLHLRMEWDPVRAQAKIAS